MSGSRRSRSPRRRSRESSRPANPVGPDRFASPSRSHQRDAAASTSRRCPIHPQPAPGKSTIRSCTGVQKSSASCSPRPDDSHSPVQRHPTRVVLPDPQSVAREVGHQPVLAVPVEIPLSIWLGLDALSASHRAWFIHTHSPYGAPKSITRSSSPLPSRSPLTIALGLSLVDLPPRRLTQDPQADARPKFTTRSFHGPLQTIALEVFSNFRISTT